MYEVSNFSHIKFNRHLNYNYSPGSIMSSRRNLKLKLSFIWELSLSILDSLELMERLLTHLCQPSTSKRLKTSINRKELTRRSTLILPDSFRLCKELWKKCSRQWTRMALANWPIQNSEILSELSPMGWMTTISTCSLHLLMRIKMSSLTGMSLSLSELTLLELSTQGILWRNRLIKWNTQILMLWS